MSLSIPDIFMCPDPLAYIKTLANIHEVIPVIFTPENMHVDVSALVFEVTFYAGKFILLSVCHLHPNLPWVPSACKHSRQLVE